MHCSLVLVSAEMTFGEQLAFFAFFVPLADRHSADLCMPILCNNIILLQKKEGEEKITCESAISELLSSYSGQQMD